MKVYLAAHYNRKEELRGYAEKLEQRGIEVVASWLHNPESQSLDPTNPESMERGATRDYKDILEAGVVISFTEAVGAIGLMRGGRHVEFGLGYALCKRMVIVGPRENIFSYLPGVEQYDSIDDLIQVLDREGHGRDTILSKNGTSRSDSEGSCHRGRRPNKAVRASL